MTAPAGRGRPARRTSAVARAVVGGAALFLVADALACPVCGGGGANAQAYIDTMVFLSIFPLGLISAVVGVVWLNYR